jgi:glycosyltransferase involved in cell wall biosynthesis
MRIFLLHYYLKQPNPAYGQLAAALRRRGHEVWIGSPDKNFDLAWHDGQTVVDKCIGPGQRTGRPDDSAALLQNWAFLRRVRESIRRHGPDIVQVNPAAFPFVGALPLAMPSGIRFVIDWRQVAAPTATRLVDQCKQAVKRALRTTASRYLFDRATFLHEAGARMFLGSMWTRWATVVPLGVDAQFLSAPARVHAGNEERKVQFLYIGSLSRVRKLDQLLAAATLLKQQTSNFELHLVGPDNTEGYFQTEIQRLGLDEVAAVLPAVAYADIPQLVAAADVALAYVPEEPTDWQYQPTLKVLEYRALGVPIIATDVPPNRWEIDDGVNGLLCSNDPAAWASAMATFVNRSERVAVFRDRAQSMRRAISWCDVAEMYERDVYVAMA